MGVVRRRVGDAPTWSWDGVVPRDYASGARRHVLVGEGDGAGQVELRYFTIPPGGASVRERHGHEHAIVILHGRASVLIGAEVHEVGPGDAVFIASGEEHQLTAGPDAPLGFLCTAVVGRQRPG
ncbi:MAG: cupin domain-containing protein [Actinomycetota bacterium]